MEESTCETCGIGFLLPSGRCDHCNVRKRGEPDPPKPIWVDQICKTPSSVSLREACEIVDAIGTRVELRRKKEREAEMRHESEFLNAVNEMIAESGKYDSCMSVYVCEEGKAVELCLDTSIATYSEGIAGEGADIALMRCQDTHRVVGVRLPLLRNNLCVFHHGPIRINTGFRKRESEVSDE